MEENDAENLMINDTEEKNVEAPVGADTEGNVAEPVVEAAAEENSAEPVVGLDVEENLAKPSTDENTDDTTAYEAPTAMIEYKEIDEPCVALTIIGENRLTDAEVFVRRGFKFSFKAFFSTLVLTILNMFI